MIMFLIAMAAFLIPGIQVYLFIQQNQIMKNQEKFFNIEVYGIIASGLTTGDMVSKQIHSAMLSRADEELLSRIITDVFRADFGVAFTSQEVDTRAQQLRDAAVRGHLILALIGSQRVQRCLDNP